MSKLQFLRAARRAMFILALPLAASAGATTFDAQCTPQLAPLEQRIYDRVGAGPDALRQFLWIRRGILQLEIHDTAAWAEALANARLRCLKAQAAGQPVRTSAR